MLAKIKECSMHLKCGGVDHPPVARDSVVTKRQWLLAVKGAGIRCGYYRRQRNQRVPRAPIYLAQRHQRNYPACRTKFHPLRQYLSLKQSPIKTPPVYCVDEFIEFMNGYHVIATFMIIATECLLH